MKSFAKNITTYSTSAMLLALLCVLVTSNSMAQTKNPFREYTNPDEIVTFDRSTDFTETVEVINQFMQEYENKFVVDLSGYTGEIGVSLPPMHWKDALNYILRIRELTLKEYPDYYEIIVTPISDSPGSGEAQVSNAGAVDPASIATTHTTETREVRINATFFEGNRRALEEIGIDWSTLTSNVPANIQDFVGAGANESIPQTAFVDQFVSINASNANQVSQNVFNALVNLGEIGPGISVQALFSTFESNNLGSVIATPSVKVVDGVEGKIQDGQDFSVKQRDFAGNVTDAFFSTGTILTVTPTVIDYNDTTFIHLDISAERSSALPDAVSTIINKQQVDTQTLVLNGEATAIAGLYRTSEIKVRRGIPFLKDLPGWFLGLKYLFGYSSNDKVENELVIIIQAELEKTLAERMDEKLQSKGEVLAAARDRFKNEMDYVISEEERGLPTPKTEETKMEEKPDTAIVNKEPDVIEKETPVQKADSTEEKKELTNEQKQELEKLSMPIKNPELMVVVPKAFDLNEYLAKREQGEVETPADDSNLKYFVIGGSFIVPNNATNFAKLLDSQGYESRILFHPSTRFNYVAYYSFSDYDEAVETAKRMRKEINDETWLFTIQSDVEFKKDN